jgi:hypothetical protein
MSVAGWDAGGIASFELVNFLFQGQFHAPLQHDRQLFSCSGIGLMAAPSARPNGDHHRLQLAVFIRRPQRLDFGL